MVETNIRMENTTTSVIQVTPGILQTAGRIDAIVKFVEEQSTSQSGFLMAVYQSQAIKEIKELFTGDFMANLMGLKGTRLGFLTDKDKDGPNAGYTEEVIKNCVIEALLNGLQVTGNQFNIISAKSYTTKEGYEFLLDKITKLTYDVVPGLPNTTSGKTNVTSTVSYKHGDKPLKTRTITFPVKVNSGMGEDAVIGKIERKCYKWIYEDVTGRRLSDGDIESAAVTIGDAPKAGTPAPQPVAQQPVAQPERNEHIQQAEFEEVKTTDAPVEVTEWSKINIDEKTYNTSKDYILKAKDKLDLEKRWKWATDRFGSFTQSVYDEVFARVTA